MLEEEDIQQRSNTWRGLAACLTLSIENRLREKEKNI